MNVIVKADVILITSLVSKEVGYILEFKKKLNDVKRFVLMLLGSFNSRSSRPPVQRTFRQNSFYRFLRFQCDYKIALRSAIFTSVELSPAFGMCKLATALRFDGLPELKTNIS